MLNLALTILFATGRLSTDGCDGVVLLDHSSPTGYTDVECNTPEFEPGSYPFVTSGNFTVEFNGEIYDDCALLYTSTTKNGVKHHYECPGVPLSQGK